MNRIPTTPGSDWRDLPNKSIIAEEGKVALKLNYRYQRPDGSKGVCSCFMVDADRRKGDYCEPDDRQTNTLIPWAAAHIAHRNKTIRPQFYGRAPWDGYFKTTMTVPDPMRKQEPPQSILAASTLLRNCGSCTSLLSPLCKIFNWKVLNVKNPRDTLKEDVLALLHQEPFPRVAGPPEDGVLPPGKPLDMRHVP